MKLINIPADKLGHLKAGCAAAAYGLVIGALAAWAFAAVTGADAETALQVGLIAAGACAFTSASAAGLTKEKADADDNKIHPGMHGVEVADALVTTSPGALVCAVCCGAAVALRLGLL